MSTLADSLRTLQGHAAPQSPLTKEDWDEIFAARERGVYWREIFATLPAGYYSKPESLCRAAMNEDRRRAKKARRKLKDL